MRLILTIRYLDNQVVLCTRFHIFLHITANMEKANQTFFYSSYSEDSSCVVLCDISLIINIVISFTTSIYTLV